DFHRRQSTHGVGDYTANDHHQAGTIRLRWRNGDRRCDAADLVCSTAADQRLAGVERQAPRCWRREKALMAAAASLPLGTAATHAQRFEANPATREASWVKFTILTLALAFFILFLLLPLVTVFVQALRKGWDAYLAALIEPDVLSAIVLTLV